MRTITFECIKEAVCRLCGQAACDLPPDVLAALKSAAGREKNVLAQVFFEQYLLNSEIAGKERLPLCQDTGFAVFFVAIGREVIIDGGTLSEAINAGVREGYKKYYLRKSIVSDPLFDRKNTFTILRRSSIWNKFPGISCISFLPPKAAVRKI